MLAVCTCRIIGHENSDEKILHPQLPETATRIQAPSGITSGSPGEAAFYFNCLLNRIRTYGLIY